MRTLTRLAIAMVAIALAVASTADAKEKRKKKARVPHATLITEVSPTSISTKYDKIEKTVAITPATEIYVRDEKAAVSALQPGMAVNVTLAMDGVSASRISAADAPVLRPLPEKTSKNRR